MTNNFNVKLNCVVFSTNIALNQRLVLSLTKDSIVLPALELNSEMLGDIEQSLMKFLKQYVFVSDLELIPQLINLHSNTIPSESSDLNVIYGFIVNHTQSINNCFWVEFDLLKEQTYSPLLFEVIQKLQ